MVNLVRAISAGDWNEIGAIATRTNESYTVRQKLSKKQREELLIRGME